MERLSSSSHASAQCRESIDEVVAVASCASSDLLDFPSGEGVTDVEGGEAEAFEEEELEPVWGEGLAPPSLLVSIDFPSGEGEAGEEEEAEDSVTAAIFLSDLHGRNSENREGSLEEEGVAPPPPPFASDFLLEEGAADEEDEAEARSFVLHLAPVLP